MVELLREKVTRYLEKRKSEGNHDTYALDHINHYLVEHPGRIKKVDLEKCIAAEIDCWIGFAAAKKWSTGRRLPAEDRRKLYTTRQELYAFLEYFGLKRVRS